MRKQPFVLLHQGQHGLERPPRFFGSPGETGPASNAVRTGPVRSTPIPFALIANADSLNLAAANPERVGIMLQNKDPTQNLFFNFGSVASINTFSCAPGQVVLLDFICPTDAVYVFAAFNIQGMYTEFSRT